MNKPKQKIVVMGLGNIGLPTASMLATKGHQVQGVDGHKPHWVLEQVRAKAVWFWEVAQ